MQEEPLRIAYPRLFSLSSNKSISVAEMMVRLDAHPLAETTLFRRQLRGWETDSLKEMREKVAAITLDPNKPDKLIWEADNLGKFSVKAATMEILKASHELIEFDFFGIWKSKMPPKIQGFLWLLTLQRIPSKVMLKDRGIKMSNTSSVCSQCELKPESAQHIFMECSTVVSFWHSFFNWWNICFIFPQDFKGFCKALFEPMLLKQAHKIWLLSIGAALWSIWLARNECEFNKNKWNHAEIFFTAKLRALNWIKAKLNKSESFNEEIWWLSPHKIGANFVQQPPATRWSPPLPGWMKFNVDAYICVAKETAGIGGVLRNDIGSMIAMFAYKVNPTEVENLVLAAIKSAASKFSELAWAANSKLAIESDSAIVISWCSTSALRPWRFIRTFEEIERSSNGLLEVAFVHTRRESNALAGHLAKLGSRRESPFFASWLP